MYRSDNQDRGAVIYRVVIGIVLVLLAVASAFVVLAAVQAIELRHILADWSPPGWRPLPFLDGLSWTSRLGVAAGAAIIGLVAIAITMRLFPRSASTAALHILEADEGGFVVVDSRSISTIAAQAAMSVQGVIDVEVAVKGTGTSPVRLKVEAGVYPGANVKRCGNEVREAVRRTVETLVGIDVRDVTIKAYVIETDALARVMR
ncbi:MAG: alkaline shock response membrane anchor protein AmaP [Polyangia bacterium]